jgi:transposase InsO family protein
MKEEQRKAAGLKRFSIISPVLNGQIENRAEYFRAAAEKPIDMPGYGLRRYSEKTLSGWLSDYMRGGIDALIRPTRNDKGKSRKINDALAERIITMRQEYPYIPVTVLYEKLIAEGVFAPKEVSIATMYRFIEDMTLRGEFKEVAADEKQTRRFSHEHAGDLVQIDILYGPHVKERGKRAQSYLHMVLDDCTRYPLHSGFYLSQSFEAHRNCFKQAVMKFGIPKIAYTDNARIYRSQQFEFICASLGCTLLHSQPFEPQGRGKVERLFRTVRMRFLASIDKDFQGSLDELNNLYNKWLADDYTHKAHSALDGLSPHDVLMSQADKLRLPSDRRVIDEAFMLRVTRKISHVATTQIGNVIYETDAIFANNRYELRYEPEWIGDASKPLMIFHDGKAIGEARMVRFHDNAHVKRRNTSKHDVSVQSNNDASHELPTLTVDVPSSFPSPLTNTISFSSTTERGV